VSRTDLKLFLASLKFTMFMIRVVHT
jgi:hypothetical protein